jgi:hypothetical protein
LATKSQLAKVNEQMLWARLAAVAVIGIGGAGALHSASHSAVTPRTGDWEGVAHGFHASFELIHNPANAAYGAKPYGMYDLVTTMPGSCPVDEGQLFITDEGSRKYQVLISRSGEFPWHGGGKPIGSITGSRSAREHASYDVQDGSQTCRGTLHFRFHPAHRRPVADGSWTLAFADGEHQRVRVTDGGRVTSIGFPKIEPKCPGQPRGPLFGGMELFIPADGRVDQTVHQHPGATTLSWMFTGANTGHGSFVATAPGCRSSTLTFQARHRS